jgi:acyl carrier protein
VTDEIIQKVIEIVAEESCVSKEQVTLDTTFVELGVDSLDFLCIVNRVRNEVGPIRDVFIGSIEKVSDLAAAVGAKVEV